MSDPNEQNTYKNMLSLATKILSNSNFQTPFFFATIMPGELQVQRTK